MKIEAPAIRMALRRRAQGRYDPAREKLPEPRLIRLRQR